ncbi:hypothetical protein ACFTS5_10120 [Nocardia sp. NPDC056952]|uniref:hypothetical protein n=1 Tax=Nocardia sp. NPDC056952 TaxID=3345979 RepID=UPI0036275A06
MSSFNGWDPKTGKFEITPPSDDLNDENDYEVEDDNNEPDPIIAEELRRGQS